MGVTMLKKELGRLKKTEYEKQKKILAHGLKNIKNLAEKKAFMKRKLKEFSQSKNSELTSLLKETYKKMFKKVKIKLSKKNISEKLKDLFTFDEKNNFLKRKLF